MPSGTTSPDRRPSGVSTSHEARPALKGCRRAALRGPRRSPSRALDLGRRPPRRRGGRRRARRRRPAAHLRRQACAAGPRRARASHRSRPEPVVRARDRAGRRPRSARRSRSRRASTCASAAITRASSGRRRAAQSATRTPATQMAPKAATTTAVVIPSPFPWRNCMQGRPSCIRGAPDVSLCLPNQRGVRYTPRPQVAGFNPCHWFVTTIDRER